MIDEEGTLITDKEDVTREFKKVFEKMLNITFQIKPENKNVVRVEQQLEELALEIKMAIKLIKGDKVPGEESIIPDLLKKEGSTLLTKLKQLINKI